MNQKGPVRCSLILLLSLVSPMACGSGEDQAIRLSVKGLAAAPLSQAREQMDRVAAWGSRALPDIEQEFQGSERLARLRLLLVLERIHDRDALAFLRHVARWDEEAEVRKEAARVADVLAEPIPARARRTRRAP